MEITELENEGLLNFSEMRQIMEMSKMMIGGP